MGMELIIVATAGMKEGTRTVTFIVVSITYEKRATNLSSLCSVFGVTVSLICFVIYTGMSVLLTLFGNADEYNDFMSWPINVATVCK